jgi:hypothetical protein
VSSANNEWQCSRKLPGVERGLLIACLTACGNQIVEFPLGADAGVDGPSVSFTNPVSGASEVGPNRVLSATFDRPMDAETVDEVAFVVTRGSSSISGEVALDDTAMTATFTPDAALDFAVSYRATIGVQAMDMDHRPLRAAYAWSFTTSTRPFDVVESSAAAEVVPVPDYTLRIGGLELLADALDIVQSATGSAVLTARFVPGQSYVVSVAARLLTYAEIDAAYGAGPPRALTEVIPPTLPPTVELPADDFMLVDADLTASVRRTLIVANSINEVRSYQLFAITFNGPPRPAN